MKFIVLHVGLLRHIVFDSVPCRFDCVLPMYVSRHRGAWPLSDDAFCNHGCYYKDNDIDCRCPISCYSTPTVAIPYCFNCEIWGVNFE